MVPLPSSRKAYRSRRAYAAGVASISASMSTATPGESAHRKASGTSSSAPPAAWTTIGKALTIAQSPLKVSMSSSFGVGGACDGAILEPEEKHDCLDVKAADEDERRGEKSDQYQDRARPAERDHRAGDGGDAVGDEHHQRRNHEVRPVAQVDPECAAALEALPEVLRFGEDVHSGQKDTQPRRHA
jgi:hypothetical protein